MSQNKKLIRFEWTEVKFALGMNGGYKAGAFRWYVSCCGQAVRQNCCRLQDLSNAHTIGANAICK